MTEALASDAVVRQAAFEHVRARSAARGGTLISRDLLDGFTFEGRRIPLVNPQRGIFKPRQLPCLLSIRTVIPRKGARVWYDDQREAHRQIFQGRDTVTYAFMGDDPDAAENVWLREAMAQQTPVIYFLGVAPGRYQALLPTFIVGWEPAALQVRLAFTAAQSADLVYRFPDATERRYALREVQQRLHQDVFRESVLAAYGNACAISGLAEPRLLDAAHIVPDRDEALGQPVVPNGLPLTKIHHAAFDANLIGIDPDFRVHVSRQLAEMHDGPFLEEGLKAIAGRPIRLPRRQQDRPDRDRLAVRFEKFRQAS